MSFVMSSARWQVVTRIFEAALGVPVQDRCSLVKQMCAGDMELESEVSRLLLADNKAESFLEKPAILNYAKSQTSLSESPLLSSGSVLSARFEILRFIGQGGMGQVYEALDLELKGKVAIKTIRPDISSDARMLARFRREVQLTRLITHPNVCRTFDIDRHSSTEDGASNDITFLTMELLEGQTLAELLRRQGRLSSEQAQPLVLQMVAALGAAHSVGVIHRDFKPSNVLLVSSTKAPRVVVTDFGLARAVFARENSPTESVATSLTGRQGMMGTIVYMAPEQFERGEASVASDIYSLGLVMFEVVTGRRPFADDIPFAEATKRLRQPAAPARTLVPDLDLTWDTTISRCLALDPKDRFETVQHIGEALTACDGSPRRHSIAAPSAQLDKKTGPAYLFTGFQRGKLLTAIGIILVAVSLSVVIFRLYWLRKEEAKLAEGSTVLLMNIHNGTGDVRFDNTTELVRYQLLQSPYFSLMDSDNVRNTLAQMLKPAALLANTDTGASDLALAAHDIVAQIQSRVAHIHLFSGS